MAFIPRCSPRKHETTEAGSVLVLAFLLAGQRRGAHRATLRNRLFPDFVFSWPTSLRCNGPPQKLGSHRIRIHFTPREPVDGRGEFALAEHTLLQMIHEPLRDQLAQAV